MACRGMKSPKHRPFSHLDLSVSDNNNQGHRKQFLVIASMDQLQMRTAVNCLHNWNVLCSLPEPVTRIEACEGDIPLTMTLSPTPLHFAYL